MAFLLEIFVPTELVLSKASRGIDILFEWDPLREYLLLF